MGLTPDQERIGRRDEIIRGLEPKVAGKMRILVDPNKIWQPSDLLPDLRLSGNDWIAGVVNLREKASRLSDASLVTVVGDDVTEEALPTYMSWLNRLAVGDKTGTEPNAWGQWIRGWTAEERRHGVVFRDWLMLSGRVDMRQVDRTTQYLIRNGMDPLIGSDPIMAMVYTSLQEGATDTSHRNAGRLALQEGDTVLAKIGTYVGGDEARHKEMYRSIVTWAFEEDANETMLALGEMLDQGITMPAALMDDEGTFAPGVKKRSPLFERFSAVAQIAGIYTVGDYVNLVMEQLAYWKVADRQVSGDAARVQNEICTKFTPNYRDRLETVIAKRLKSEYGSNPPTFSWIDNREIPLNEIKALEKRKPITPSTT